MKRATPLCLLFLALAWPAVRAEASDDSSDPPVEPAPAAESSRADEKSSRELEVTFHERKPYLETLTLAEPDEQAEPHWEPYRLKLEFFEVGTVSSGEYEGSAVVLLRLLHQEDGPCKGESCGIPGYSHLRYLRNGLRMILLEAISDRRLPGKVGGSGGRFLGQDPFARFGLVEERDDRLTIPGFGYAREISGPEPRQLLRFVDEQEGRLDPEKLVEVFTHDRFGDVYTTRPELSPSNRIYSYDPAGRSRSGRPRYGEREPTPGSCYGDACFTTNAFFVFRPDGTFLRYRHAPDLDTTRSTWLPEDDAPAEAGGTGPLARSLAPPATAAYTFRSRIGCAATLVDDSAVVDPGSFGPGELKQVAVGPEGGPLFAPVPEHRVHEELYGFYLATERYDRRGETVEARLSFPDFVSARPVLLWRDPFDRLIRFTRTEFIQPHFCEPIVYLYPPAARSVTVALADAVSPSFSTPVHGASWKVLARPDGELRDAATGKSYRYLFWEAPSPFVESPERGSVVPAAEVEEFLRGALTRLGLNETERGDFIEAWLPEFGGAPYYFISFFDRKLIDALAPLEVDPAPDSVIRVLMDYRPLDGPIDVAPQEFGPAPRREGFTLVEWGGLRR